MTSTAGGARATASGGLCDAQDIQIETHLAALLPIAEAACQNAGSKWPRAGSGRIAA